MTLLQLSCCVIITCISPVQILNIRNKIRVVMKNNQPSSWNIIEAKKVFSEWLKWIAINYSVSHLSMMWWSSWYLKCFWTQKYRPVLWNSDLNISINTRMTFSENFIILLWDYSSLLSLKKDPFLLFHIELQYPISLKKKKKLNLQLLPTLSLPFNYKLSIIPILYSQPLIHIVSKKLHFCSAVF